MVFICPSDRDISKRLDHAFTSYTFNGYEVGPGAIPRITGKKLSSLPKPERAVVTGEWPAFFGGSWHPYREELYCDANNLLAFADGHVSRTRIYWDGLLEPSRYEPPPGYAYDWDGE
jgi:hypothetical protein